MPRPSIALFGGNGLVGKEVLTLLTQGNFPPHELHLLDARAPIQRAYDLAILCTPAEVSKKIVESGSLGSTTIIDLSSAFRMDPNVPLIVPEVNGHILESNPPLIASPNCCATLLLTVLAPLLYQWGGDRISLVTYQAASGAGKNGLDALTRESQDPACAPYFFPYPLAFNVFPHESPRNASGVCEEEEKIQEESNKIFGSPIPIHAFCVRVPVARAHTLVASVTFTADPAKEEIEKLLSNASGVTYCKDSFPTPIEVSGKHPVFCGPIRKDSSMARTWDFWITGDQLLKGAALNAVQIAAYFISALV